MRIVDQHHELWQAFVEGRQQYLQRCVPSAEPEAIQELHLTRKVYDALGDLKEFLDNKKGA